MVDFDPRFEIMPGTKHTETDPEKRNPYGTAIGKAIAEQGIFLKTIESVRKGREGEP